MAEPTINGIYTRQKQTAPGLASAPKDTRGSASTPDMKLNGHNVYTKKDGSKVLYWVPDGGGKWIIADAVGPEVRRPEVRRYDTACQRPH